MNQDPRNERHLDGSEASRARGSIGRLEELLMASDVGELTAAELSELQEILNESSEAREQYAKWQVTSFLLGGTEQSDEQLEGLSYSTRSVQQEVKGAISETRGLRWGHWLSLAGTVLFCALITRLVYLENWRSSIRKLPSQDLTAVHGDEAMQQEEKSVGIALVTRLVNSTVGPNSQRVARGEALRPGRLVLENGVAQLEFYCGATVVVEGPAELELVSDKEIRCYRGKLRAQVPPAARGFEVYLKDRRIVDLGTEFGVQVDGDHGALEVFDGEVELHEENVNSPSKLFAGDSAKWTSDSISFSDNVDASFLDIDALQQKDAKRSSEKYDRWREHSEELRSDPRLITYYAMDDFEDWKRKLPCSLGNSELDGAIVGAQIRRGRWGQKQSLEFKHPGDRVKVNIPGEYGSLTFCCWVRIDSLDRWYNSLFLTDNYQRGEPHWQILDTGQLFFSVRVSQQRGGPEHQEVLSPVFWTPSMSGKWIHLATTYNTDAGETTHFLNGEILSQEKLLHEKLVKTTRIGMASIGNWSSPTKPEEEFSIRNLNGRLDEFMIFSASLSPQEISQLYEKGKP